MVDDFLHIFAWTTICSNDGIQDHILDHREREYQLLFMQVFDAYFSDLLFFHFLDFSYSDCSLHISWAINNSEGNVDNQQWERIEKIGLYYDTFRGSDGVLLSIRTSIIHHYGKTR